MLIDLSTPHGFSLLTLLLSLSLGSPLAAAPSTAGRITVVYNHDRGDSAAELKPGGGFGAIVEFNGKVVLFDTGGQADILLQNLSTLDLDASRIDAVVISHNHWDHVYGLPGVLGASRNRPTVYAPEGSREAILQQNPRGTIVTADGPTEILPKIWLTGSMTLEFRGAPLTEQALVLEHEDGLVVLVGCSHPGIVAITERVREMFDGKKILFVGGGFHLRSTPRDEITTIATKLKEYGVERIAPSHCSGEGATELFLEEWGDKLVSFELGEQFEF